MNKYCLIFLTIFATNCFSFWTPIPGKFLKISGGKDGTVMAIDHQYRVWLRLGDKWKMTPGKLNTISVGSMNYIIGLDDKGQMWKFDLEKMNWNKLIGKAEEVSVGEDGIVYITNENHEVLFYKNGKWVNEHIKLFKVVAVNRNKVWGITLNGQVVQKLDGIWEIMPGKLNDLDVSSMKLAVGIKSNQTFWIWNGNKWRRIPGRLNQVTLSGRRNIWALNTEGNLYHAYLPKTKATSKKGKRNLYRITNILAQTHLSKLKNKAILLGYKGWNNQWKKNQSWRLVETKAGLFEIKNGTGLCLEDLDNNGEVTIHSCSNRDGQLWKISSFKEKTSLESYTSQLCLAVVAKNLPVKLIDCEDDERNLWKLTRIH